MLNDRTATIYPRASGMCRTPLYRAALTTQAPAEPAADPDEVFRALGLNADTFRTEGGAVNRPKLIAAILHPGDYLPDGHWLRSSPTGDWRTTAAQFLRDEAACQRQYNRMFPKEAKIDPDWVQRLA